MSLAVIEKVIPDQNLEVMANPIVKDSEVVGEQTEIETAALELKALHFEFAKAKAAFNKLKKKYDAAEAKLLKLADADIPANESEIIADVLEVSAKGKATKITDKETLINMLEDINPNLPFDMAEFKIGDVSEVLSKTQFEQVTTTENANKRRVKIL